MPTSYCVVKLYLWHVFCISHNKIASAETRERLSAEANQAASKIQAAATAAGERNAATRGAHTLETSLV